MDDALNLLEEMMHEHCAVYPLYGDGSPTFDSMANSTYAETMRLLAKHGRFEIIHDDGNRSVVAWLAEGRHQNETRD